MAASSITDTIIITDPKQAERCEDIEALLSFYQKKYGFRIFGECMTEGVENSHKLIQLMNFL